jgi:hypothetical protein
MRFTDPGCTEVGERIESLTLNRLVPHYIERRPSDAVPVKMFNIVEYCGPKGLLGAPDLKTVSFRASIVMVWCMVLYTT